jgi:hypothetical protein
MASRSKNTTKSIGFGSDDNDRALLEAVEEMLAQKMFSSFSDLCKAALQQYCLTEARSELPVSVLARKMEELQSQIAQWEAIAVADTLNRIEGQLSQLLEREAQHAAQTVLPAAEREPAGFAQLLEPLTHQLAELSDRVRRLEERPAIPVDHSQSIVPPKALESLETQLVQLRERCQRLETQLKQPTRDADNSLHPLPAETDPMFSRLTPLLEEF